MLVVLSSLFFPDLSIILFPLGTNKTLQQVSRGDICWVSGFFNITVYIHMMFSILPHLEGCGVIRIRLGYGG